ncbi:CidA/LrgA family protein [Neisseriaceae bacterium TC5R-5]|nr:CidA/LrgA family protein [Neisseriaceae bacterium TC5R-5]
MMESVLYLLGFQLVGELLVSALSWPVPGPVMGMLLLFIVLCIRRSVPEQLNQQVPRLLTHLSLLFIPAGGALLVYQPLLRDYGWRLLLVLALTTIITLLVPAWALRYSLRLRQQRTQQ